MSNEVYAISHDRAAISAMRECVTNQLDAAFNGQPDEEGRLYYCLQPWDGMHPCIRISNSTVEFVGRPAAFDAIVPMPERYAIRDAL